MHCVRRLIVVAMAGALALVIALLPSSREHPAAATAPGIDDITTFLETCPTNDPQYAQIRADFEIRREGVAAGALACSQPVSAMPIAQYTDELIVAQALRVIYYTEGGRHVAYPWTEGSLYDWMKSQIGGVDIRAGGSYCCESFGGKWYIVIGAQADGDRDFDREWRGLSTRVTLLAHETRHVQGYPHVGGCPLFPDQTFGCDQTYDESDLSPYAIEWWLHSKWLSGELYIGFSCAAPQVVSQIASWHVQVANNDLRGRFVDNLPPVLSVPPQPGGACAGSGTTPTPTPTATGVATPTPTRTPSPTPTRTPSPTPTLTATPSPTPTMTPTATPTASPTATAEPTPTATPAPTPTPSPTATPSPTVTQGQSPPPAPTDTPTPSPTPGLSLANVNCDATTDARDVIAMLEAAGGLPYGRSPGCPTPGAQVDGAAFGDASCDGRFDAHDVLALLRLIGGVPGGGCS
jgi:hypothetical protein